MSKRKHSPEPEVVKKPATMASGSVVKKIVQTALAPPAAGPYSQAVIANDTMYISGQLGFDPTTKDFVEGGVEEQARQCLKNLGAILKAAGANYDNVVKTTVLLKDINEWGLVNEVYSEFFKENPPARAAYQVAALPKDGSVEIEAVAVLGAVVNAKL